MAKALRALCEVLGRRKGDLPLAPSKCRILPTLRDIWVGLAPTGEAFKLAAARAPRAVDDQAEWAKVGSCGAQVSPRGGGRNAP